MCKLDNNFLVLIFNKLSEFDSNGINKKIKLSQLKNIVKLQAENKYSNEELLDILFNEKTNKDKTKEKKSSQEYKLPINKNFKYFDKLDKLTQEQVSMLEMRLMTEMNKYFEEMER